MGARIKMRVHLEPVELWVDLPDYVDGGIGQASVDAGWMLKDQFASVTVTLPGDDSTVTCPSSVVEAEPVFRGADTFVIDREGQ